VALASRVRKEEGERNYVAHLNAVDSDDACRCRRRSSIGSVKWRCHVVVVVGVCSGGRGWWNDDCEVVVTQWRWSR